MGESKLREKEVTIGHKRSTLEPGANFPTKICSESVTNRKTNGKRKQMKNQVNKYLKMKQRKRKWKGPMAKGGRYSSEKQGNDPPHPISLDLQQNIKEQQSTEHTATKNPPAPNIPLLSRYGLHCSSDNQARHDCSN